MLINVNLMYNVFGGGGGVIFKNWFSLLQSDIIILHKLTKIVIK